MVLLKNSQSKNHIQNGRISYELALGGKCNIHTILLCNIIEILYLQRFERTLQDSYNILEMF